MIYTKIETTKKSACADLVDLTGLLIDWLDTLGCNVADNYNPVKSLIERGVDLPGVEPGRLGVSSQSSKPARPTSAFSLPQIARDCFVVALFLLAMTVVMTIVGAKPVRAATSSIFSLSLWVNPSTSVASKALIGKAEEMRVFTNASGYIGCQIRATTWQTAAQSTTKALTLGSWSHIVCTYDKVNLTIYVNGSLTSQTSLTSQVDDTAAALKIGQDDSASTPYGNLAGIVDEFKFYNLALTADEVKTEYNQGKTAVLGSLSDTSQLTGGSVASNSANALYCIPGDATSCAVPVGEWKMDENTGTSANDTSGNGLTGTVTSASWTTGKNGSALNFDGTNSYVTSSGPAFGTAGTIEFWAYPNFDPTTLRTGIFNYVFDSTNGHRYLIFKEDTANYWALLIDSTQICADCLSGLMTGYQWNHVTITWDNSLSSNREKIYSNGVLLAQYNQVITSATPTNLWIGQRYSGTERWNGKIDDFRVYNYARTPAQIAWDYNKGAPIAKWDFNDCTGTIIHDSAANANGTTAGMNGTLTLSGNAAGTCTSLTTTDAWYLGATGKFGAALGLDGNDYMTITDTASYAFAAATQDFSAFAWVKRAAAGVNHFVISKEDGANDGWNMQITSGNLVSCAVNDKVFTSTSTIDTNWHHIGCVVSRAGNGQVYIDGRPDGTAVAISSTAMAIASTTTTIGVRNYTPAGTYFNGLIDDMRIFNYALTTTQVKTLYNENSAVRWGN